MRKWGKFFIIPVFCCITGVIACATLTSRESATIQEEESEEIVAEAKSLEVSAELGSDHPEIPEGVSCNDCHEITLDAKTTATQVWLYGEYLGKSEGEGIMPPNQLWQEIVAMIGGIKNNSKTYVLGTCMNNRPLTTTAEWTLDPERKMLYGVHEMGTEKLVHIKNNPWVSLNWHDEFVGIEGPYRCCQIQGRCELLEGSNPEFEKILLDFAPYEDAAQRMMPKNPTLEQREAILKKLRDQVFKERFLISKITIDRITVVNKAFLAKGYRNVQRWERQSP